MDYFFGVGQSTKGGNTGDGPGLTLQGCAAAGCPAEGEADAGLPPLDSEAVPGSVVPLPQMWGLPFAESEQAPVEKEREGRGNWILPSPAPAPRPGPTKTSFQIPTHLPRAPTQVRLAG